MPVKYRSIAGLTIVEVLIAIAVISAVLMTAFGIVRKTSMNAQTVKEHGHALKILETQSEFLRRGAAEGVASSNYPISTSGSYPVFCYDVTGNRSRIDPATDVFVLPDHASAPDPYEAACRQGPDGRYYIAIQEVAPNTFKSRIYWLDASGGQSKEEIMYKVY